MHVITTKNMMISALALTLILTSCLGTAPKRASAEGKSSIRSDSSLAMQRIFKQRDNVQQRTRAKRLPIVGETAALLNLEEAQLKQQLALDKSLSDISLQQGMSAGELAGKLLELRSGNIERAVESGRLNSVTADAIRTRMTRHIDFMLRQKGSSLLEDEKTEAADHPLQAFDPDKMAAIIGTTPEALSGELQAGRTLTEIAEANGVTKPQLLHKIKTALATS